jgi:hypothetical protein
MSTQPGRRTPFEALQLEYPLSIGVFETYPQAQKAVDTLSDAQFPVQNCLIVGTELRQLERVTGRLTWSRVLLGGALSGCGWASSWAWSSRSSRPGTNT